MLHLDWNQEVCFLFCFFFPSAAILILYILSARPLLSDLSAAATQGNYLITQWVSHHSCLSSGHCDELSGECIVWVHMSVCVSLQSVLNYACVNRHPTFPSMPWIFHIQHECWLPFILQHEANYWTSEVLFKCIFTFKLACQFGEKMTKYDLSRENMEYNQYFGTMLVFNWKTVIY